MSKKERRDFYRHLVSLEKVPIILYGESGSIISGIVFDMSKSGMQLTLHRPIPVGEVFSFAIDLSAVSDIFYVLDGYLHLKRQNWSKAPYRAGVKVEFNTTQKKDIYVELIEYLRVKSIKRAMTQLLGEKDAF